MHRDKEDTNDGFRNNAYGGPRRSTTEWEWENRRRYAPKFVCFSSRYIWAITAMTYPDNPWSDRSQKRFDRNRTQYRYPFITRFFVHNTHTGYSFRPNTYLHLLRIWNILRQTRELGVSRPANILEWGSWKASGGRERCGVDKIFTSYACPVPIGNYI